jgi:hypothetical protein
VLSPAEQAWAAGQNRVAETAAAKRAILDALGLDRELAQLWSEIDVRLGAGHVIYVKTTGTVQKKAWQLKAIDYKVAFNRGPTELTCTAAAVADMTDILP